MFLFPQCLISGNIEERPHVPTIAMSSLNLTTQRRWRYASMNFIIVFDFLTSEHCAKQSQGMFKNVAHPQSIGWHVNSSNIFTDILVLTFSNSLYKFYIVFFYPSTQTLIIWTNFRDLEFQMNHKPLVIWVVNLISVV